MRKLSSSNRSALIKLASSLPSGSPERRAILAGLQQKAASGEVNIPDVHIFDNAVVDSKAKVFGNARVRDEAELVGKAQVYGNADVSEGAWVSGKVFGDAIVSGDTMISGKVYGKARVKGKTKIMD